MIFDAKVRYSHLDVFLNEEHLIAHMKSNGLTLQVSPGIVLKSGKAFVGTLSDDRALYVREAPNAKALNDVLICLQKNAH